MSETEYVYIRHKTICWNKWQTETCDVRTELLYMLFFQITMTWSSDNVSVHDYEVGLASTSNDSAPNIMGFRSTKQHRRIHIMHTDLPEGTPFYIVIKSISKANVEGLQVEKLWQWCFLWSDFFFFEKRPDVSYLFTITFQFIGPCYVDVTGPIFTPPISVIHSNGHLLAFWSKDAFQDLEDPFSLNFEYALGEKKD